MSERTLAQMLSDLQQTQQAFLDIVDRAGETALYRRPAEDSWTLAETLVHIAEARQFFTGETRKVLATPGLKIGRTMEHEGRLKNIAEHGHDSPGLIRQKLIDSYQAMVKLLSQMNQDDLRLQGEHIRFGPQTLAEFIQRFMVEHDQAHARQAQALLTGQTEA